jgi:hypothetical protein
MLVRQPFWLSRTRGSQSGGDEDQPQCRGLWHGGSPSARSLSRSPSPPPPSFTQSPSPPCSLARDGQTSPHRPRIVVSRSTCPPLSPSPHANNFVLGPPVINTHKGREGGNKEKCTKNRERRKERGKKGKGKKRGGGGGGFFSFEERKERERKEEEEEEEEEEDLFVFNNTIKGPRATALKPFFSPPSFHTPSLFPAFISV